MIRNADYTLYVLKNISLPLVLASLKTCTPKSRETETIAALLDRSVHLTQEMEKALSIGAEISGGIPVKLHLAALASSIISAETQNLQTGYQKSEIKEVVKSLSVALAQVEQFSFTCEINESASEPDLIEALKSLSPIIGPIAEFSFGFPEKKLIQNVSDKLLTLSKEMIKRLIGQLQNPAQKHRAEITMLSILAPLYAQTHTSETKNIMAMDENIRNQNASQLTIDIVWRSFDRQCALLEALIEGLIPAEQTTPPPTDLLDDELFDAPISPQTPTSSVLQDDNPLSFFVKTKK